MDKARVLFVCEHNSARSQMAEAFLNHLGGCRFEARSAGLEPGTLHPLAVEAMEEIGVDISGNKTKSVRDFTQKGEHFDYVITVCDERTAERCPFFPGISTRLHWNIEDPSTFTGTREERLARTRAVRDTLKARVEEFIRTAERD